MNDKFTCIVTDIQQIDTGTVFPCEIVKTPVLEVAVAEFIFILIVIAIAIFYLGLFLGAWTSARRLADATGKAIVDSDLTLDQQSDLLDKIKEYSKQK